MLSVQREAKMYEAKTKPTDADVQAYLDALEKPERRADCDTLIDLMSAATGSPPVMWGTSIVGFGRYHYKYDSGHEGDACLTGFASRKGDLSIYIIAGFDAAAPLLARLGKHKIGKACLYVSRLANVDLAVLDALIRASVADVRRKYPTP
jgi:hypothetical protein